MTLILASSVVSSEIKGYSNVEAGKQCCDHRCKPCITDFPKAVSEMEYDKTVTMLPSAEYKFLSSGRKPEDARS